MRQPDGATWLVLGVMTAPAAKQNRRNLRELSHSEPGVAPAPGLSFSRARAPRAPELLSSGFLSRGLRRLPTHNARAVFVLGDCECARNGTIREAAYHRDIVYVKSDDCRTWHRPSKVFAWFQFAVSRWPRASWYAKSEDDGMVRLTSLMRDLGGLDAREPWYYGIGKVSPRQRPSSASVPPQGSPDGSRQLSTPRKRPARRVPRHCLGCSRASRLQSRRVHTEFIPSSLRSTVQVLRDHATHGQLLLPRHLPRRARLYRRFRAQLRSQLDHRPRGLGRLLRRLLPGRALPVPLAAQRLPWQAQGGRQRQRRQRQSERQRRSQRQGRGRQDGAKL